MARNSKNKLLQISGEDAYELLKLQAAQQVEEKVYERLKTTAKRLGIVGSIAAVIAGAFGVTSVWNYVSDRIDSSVEQAVEQRVAARLSRLEARIDATWESGVLAKNASEQVRDSMTRLEKEVADSRNNVESIASAALSAQDTVGRLQEALTKQEDNLTRTQHLVTDLFKSLKNETIKVEEGARVKVIPYADRRAIVAVRLDAVPIRESVRLQWHIFAQPPNSFRLNQNILIFNWADDIATLSIKPLYVSYAADSTAPRMLGDLSVRPDGLYAGDVPVVRLALTSDSSPEGQKVPH